MPFINEKIPPIKAKGKALKDIKSSRDIFLLLFPEADKFSAYDKSEEVTCEYGI